MDPVPGGFVPVTGIRKFWIRPYGIANENIP